MIKNYKLSGVIQALKRAVQSNHLVFLPIEGREFCLLMLDLSGNDFVPLDSFGPRMLCCASSPIVETCRSVFAMQ